MKLLRVLETGLFQRWVPIASARQGARVSATMQTCRRIASGRFREDLYYRLNAIELQVAPLAERPDDILPLARHFLPAGKRLSADAERALLRHAWPGNVRELRNVVQRAALLSGNGDIDAGALGLPSASTGAAVHGEEPDRAMIEAALSRANGVIAQAASDLGLSRQALYRRLDRLGIPRN